MSVSKLVVAVAAMVMSLGAVPSADAASLATEAFLANVRPNVDFLEQSSRLGADRAAASDMRVFARGEIDEAARTSLALDVLTPSDHSFAVAAASSDADGLMTGRSAGVEVPVKPAGFGQAANARMPLGQAETARLKTLSGPAFDDYFWTKQLDALSQLRADYRRYLAVGDDAAILAIARRELPKVEQRLLQLSKI